MIHHRLLMLFVKIGLGPQVEPQFATKNMVVAFVNTRKYKINFLIMLQIIRKGISVSNTCLVKSNIFYKLPNVFCH